MKWIVCFTTEHVIFTMICLVYLPFLVAQSFSFSFYIFRNKYLISIGHTSHSIYNKYLTVLNIYLKQASAYVFARSFPGYKVC